jgi:hypothetical protein
VILLLILPLVLLGGLAAFAVLANRGVVPAREGGAAWSPPRLRELRFGTLLDEIPFGWLVGAMAVMGLWILFWVIVLIWGLSLIAG